MTSKPWRRLAAWPTPWRTASRMEWEPVFRDRWLPLLHEAVEAITAADPVRIGQVRTALSALSADLSDADLSARHWPECGALMLNLRNIVTVMDRVADHGPLQPHRYTTRRRRLLPR